MSAPSTAAVPTVVVVGAGASGSLSALHLLRTAARRSTDLEVLLLDPTPRWARGVAFGTPDLEHLLNVPASGMSAFPEQPTHFVRWLERQDPQAAVDPAAFVSRAQFALYLDDTLTEAVAATAGQVRLRHVRDRAVGVRRTAVGASVVTGAGRELPADAVVVATGLPHVGHDWAPEALRASAFFVADPWRPGALDVVRRDHAGPPDVLVVGTGLTMVDVVLSLSGAPNRPDRNLHAISRKGRLPAAHAAELVLAAIPDVTDWGDRLPALRTHVARHVSTVARATGDWRPAVDGLRYQVAHLWNRLDEQDRREFLAKDAGAWNLARHRMAPSSAVVLRELRRRPAQRGRRRGGRCGAAVPRRPLRRAVRRQPPRRRLGGQLHRTAGRRTPARQPAARRPAAPAGRSRAGDGGHRRHGLPHRPGPAARHRRPHRRAAVDARRAAPRRAVGVHRRPGDPHPGAGAGDLGPRRGRPARRAGSRTAGWSAGTIPSPGPATRWGCRCPRRPRRPRRTTRDCSA